MACINPDGTLSAVAKAVLVALDAPLDEAALARAVDYPLYRVRASLREIGRAELVARVPDSDPPAFVRTALGAEVLELDATAG